MINENKDQLIDIYAMWYEPFWSTTWFYYLAIVCVGAGTAYVLWRLYKKYIYKKVIVDCATVALQDLESLKKIHIVTQADSKDSYFRLSLILKHYLAARYHFASLQLTDTEIVMQAHHLMNDEQRLALQIILQAMTLLKFEHQVAQNEKLEKDIEAIIQFVQATTYKQESV
jgi:hypothetical protein